LLLLLLLLLRQHTPPWSWKAAAHHTHVGCSCVSPLLFELQGWYACCYASLLLLLLQQQTPTFTFSWKALLSVVGSLTNIVLTDMPSSMLLALLLLSTAAYHFLL
jgi:hypothetical protein